MKLTTECRDKLKEHTRAKTRLALSMNKSVHTIELWLTNNSDNLTKAECLRIIREELELSDDQILEDTPTEAVNKEG